MTGRPRYDGDPIARHTLSARELKELITAERAGEPFLAFRNQHGDLGLFVLDRTGEVITVGRREETDLSIPWDGQVSGLHAELRRLGGEWTIIDDGLSTNGTFVNGERISGRQRLRDTDLVRIGQTTLAFNAAAQITSPRPTAVAAEYSAPQMLTDAQRRVLIALCRPYREGRKFTTPASNQQIADAVCLSVDAVKMHLRSLFNRFELSELPQNRKRARLAELVLQLGLITQRDLI
jgi:pSer/pThr/pTyr-binding forkhead associated (FHA) protein